jgi:hypothetical protein
VKRSRDDSIKSGKGVDSSLGEDFVRPGPDQQFGYPGSRSKESSYAGKYTSNNSGLTRTDNFEGSDGSRYGGSVSRDIMDAVESNQNPGGEFDTTGPIRAGVNRGQDR